MRYIDACLKIKNLVDSGEMGDLLSICHFKTRAYGLYGAGARHRAVMEPEESGGWTVHHACHDIDFLYWINGPIKRVYATTQTTVPDEDSDMAPFVYYLKGAWVFRMLEWVIGRTDVTRALRSYRQAHPFATATTRDFIEATEAGGGEDLGSFFEQWLYGSGVMLLDESHRGDGESVQVTVSQRTPWATDPERYFKMPMTIRIDVDGRITDEIVTVDKLVRSYVDHIIDLKDQGTLNISQNEVVRRLNISVPRLKRIQAD